MKPKALSKLVRAMQVEMRTRDDSGRTVDRVNVSLIYGRLVVNEAGDWSGLWLRVDENPLNFARKMLK